MFAVRSPLTRVVVALACVGAGRSVATAGPIREGYDAAALPAATGSESDVRFFAHTFDALHVNPVGNVSFAAPLPSFNPLPLGQMRDANITPYFTKDGVYRSPQQGQWIAPHGTNESNASHDIAVSWSGGKEERARSNPSLGNPRASVGTGPARTRGGYGARTMAQRHRSSPETARSGYDGAALDHADPSDPAALARSLLETRATEYGLSLVEAEVAHGSSPIGSPSDTSGNLAGNDDSVVSTPEPGTLVLGVLGVVGMLATSRLRTTSPPSPAGVAPRR